MDIHFTDHPLSIRLIFYVIGSDIKVEFNCSEIERISIDKDFNDDSLYSALETRVIPPRLTRTLELTNHEFACIDHADYLWEISVVPEVKLLIRCLSFDWCIQKISDEELSWLNTF